MINHCERLDRSLRRSEEEVENGTSFFRALFFPTFSFHTMIKNAENLFAHSFAPQHSACSVVRSTTLRHAQLAPLAPLTLSLTSLTLSDTVLNDAVFSISNHVDFLLSNELPNVSACRFWCCRF